MMQSVEVFDEAEGFPTSIQATAMLCWYECCWQPSSMSNHHRLSPPTTVVVVVVFGSVSVTTGTVVSMSVASSSLLFPSLTSDPIVCEA